MTEIHWTNPELARRDAAVSVRVAPVRSWRLALITVDALDSLKHYIVRVHGDVEDLRDSAELAFRLALERGAFESIAADEYFEVAAVDWQGALERISKSEWYEAGIDVIAGPVEHLTLGAFEQLAIVDLTDEPVDGIVMDLL